MLPVKKPLRLPATDTGGGPFWALPNSGTRTTRKPLTSTGAASGAGKRGGGSERKEGGRGDYATEEEEDSEENWGSALPPPETTSLRWRARTEH